MLCDSDPGRAGPGQTSGWRLAGRLGTVLVRSDEWVETSMETSYSAGPVRRVGGDQHGDWLQCWSG